MAARASILDFQSECLAFFLIYKSPWYFLSNFESLGLSIQEKKFKIDFQDGICRRHLGFLIKRILAIFDLQVDSIILTKFQVHWPFGSGEEVKNRFSRWPPWWPSWISDWNNFSHFWSTSHPNASYQVSSQMAFRSGETKNRFSRWLPWRPSRISHQNNFSYFWSKSHPKLPIQVRVN